MPAAPSLASATRRVGAHTSSRPLASRLVAGAIARSHVVVPVAVAVASGAYGITRPSLWRDELITWAASTRTLGELARTLNDVDVVFAPYYVFTQVWTAVFGTSHLALRLPSLLTMAATAGVVALIGERAHSRRAGLVAGLLFAVLPTVSRYAQEARPYAFAALFVAVATLFLLRALDRPAPWRWTAYGSACAMAGWSHLIAASILLAHAVAVFAISWRAGDQRWRAWLVAAGAATVAVLPLAALGSRQTQQIYWVPLTTWQAVPEYLGRLVGTAVIAGVVFGLAAAGVSLGRDRAVVWVLATSVAIPLSALYVVGALRPLFHHRYVLFALVIAAVLAGVTLAHVSRWAAALVLTGVVLFSVTAHESMRLPGGHSDGGLDAAARVIMAGAQPGDVMVLENTGWLRFGMDYYLPADGRPRDALVVRTPAQRGSYLAAECVDIDECLAGAPRVWVVCVGQRADPLGCLSASRAEALGRSYALVRNHEAAFTVALLRLRPAAT